jgi:hypothetical protein
MSNPPGVSRIDEQVGYKMCLFFSITFIRNFFRCDKYLKSYARDANRTRVPSLKLLASEHLRAAEFLLLLSWPGIRH